MTLVFDLGNTALKCAAFDGRDKAASFSLSSTRRTADEWIQDLSEHFSRLGVSFRHSEGSVLGSVVPHLTEGVAAAVTALTGKAPLIVGPGVKTGLDIRTDYQTELGADIVANAVGARHRFAPPFLVMDFGTATTLCAVDEKGIFRGVAILPGVNGAAGALARTCANLPEIVPGTPASLLGRNTRDSLNGGISFGFATMADALVDRVMKETGVSELALLATGGAAMRVLPLCEKQFTHCPDLTLEGLCRLYEINQSPRRA